MWSGSTRMAAGWLRWVKQGGVGWDSQITFFSHLPGEGCKILSQVFSSSASSSSSSTSFSSSSSLSPSFSSTTFASTPTSARSGHCWTSTWAPLDLNLGPSELSEHRWTSTWDPPNSVSTAGPQRPDRMPEGMPHKVPKCLPDTTPKDLRDRMPDIMSEDMPDRVLGRHARTYARKYAR